MNRDEKGVDSKPWIFTGEAENLTTSVTKNIPCISFCAAIGHNTYETYDFILIHIVFIIQIPKLDNDSTFLTLKIFQIDSPSYPPPQARHRARSFPVPNGTTPTLGS